MNEVIELFLQTAGGDGGDFDPGVESTPRAHEADELLGAWLSERGRSIECQLILGRVRRLLRQVAADRAVDRRLRRRALGMIRMIRTFGQDGSLVEG